MAETRQPTADLNPPDQPNWWQDLTNDLAQRTRTDEQAKIAHWIEGESFDRPESVRLVLRELARRIRSGDYR